MTLHAGVWRALFYLRRKRTGNRMKKARLWLSLLSADVPGWYLALAVAMYAAFWVYYATTIQEGSVALPLVAAGPAISFGALVVGIQLMLILGGLWGGGPPGAISGADAQIWAIRGAAWRYVFLILMEFILGAALVSVVAVVLPLPLWRMLGFRLTAWSAAWLWVMGFSAVGAAANVRWLANAFRRGAFVTRVLIAVGGLAYGAVSAAFAAGGWRLAGAAAEQGPYHLTFVAGLGRAEVGPELAGFFGLVWLVTLLAAVAGAGKVSADELAKRAELQRQMRLAAMLGLGEERQALAERLRGRTRLRRRRSFPGYVDTSRPKHAVDSLAWRDLAGLAKTKPSRVAAAVVVAGLFGWLWQKGVIPSEWAPLVALAALVFAGIALLAPLERDVRWPEQAKLLPVDADEILAGHLRPAWLGLTALFIPGAAVYLAAAPSFDWLFTFAVAVAIPAGTRALAVSCAAGILSLEREYDRPLDQYYRTELVDPLMMWLGLGVMALAGLAAYRLTGGSAVALVAALAAAGIPVAWWLERWGARKLERLWSRSTEE